jgi:peptide/nickel transport system permease protein
MFVHVMPNAMLPQITNLGLRLGQIFSGAIITEYVFSYPGLGQLLYTAVLRADVNLMVGIVAMSVVAIATAVLVVDLTYPLFDPRIRYR